MELLIMALLLGLLTAIGFIISDWKNNKASSANQSNPPLVYSSYKLSVKELIIYVALASTLLYTVGLIFYQSKLIAIIFALIGIYYPFLRKKELIEKRKQELTQQFKQALYSLSTALVAGRSVENAFKEITDDLKLIYPNPHTYINRELDLINRRIENGMPIEKAIRDFSNRADCEDITSFADVFITCKRTGGDLIEVIRITSAIIGDKLETQQEISVLIAQKQFEAKILSIAPFILVAFISSSSPDYMEPLYHSGMGKAIMTISLIILIFSYWLSKWFMKIRV